MIAWFAGGPLANDQVSDFYLTVYEALKIKGQDFLRDFESCDVGVVIFVDGVFSPDKGVHGRTANQAESLQRALAAEFDGGPNVHSL